MFVDVPLMVGAFAAVDDLAALDELNGLLDADDTETVNTSMRLSIRLRDAAALAMETALHLHYREHPHAKPSLADIAHALAVQDGFPLAERPDLLAAAASAVVKRRPNADADDVLLWAEAQLAVSA